MHFILHFSKDLESKEKEGFPQPSSTTRASCERMEKKDNNNNNNKSFSNYNGFCAVETENKVLSDVDKKENLLENTMSVLFKDDCLMDMCESLVKNIYNFNNIACEDNLDLEMLINYAESLL